MKTRFRLVLMTLVVPFVGGSLACNEAELGPMPQEQIEKSTHALTKDVDIRRSLVVTDKPILARFPFERVMNQLVAQSGVPGMTALDLFHQWWDTQNPGAVPNSIHCNQGAGGAEEINGFPYICRPAPAGEGSEATSDPFNGAAEAQYEPVGLFNRFDLAPADGSNCGEHRIVYARVSGKTQPRNRNLIIFEAALPNPHVNEGIKGCDKVIKTWAKLTDIDDIEKRADDLEEFYFDGTANLEPVVHVDHYGNGGAGQIRTNQFIQPLPLSPPRWNLREYHLINTGGSLTMVPQTNKTNAFGPLFDSTPLHVKGPDWQDHFVTQVAGLALADSVASIGMSVPDEFNSAQSLANGSTEMDYLANLPMADAYRTDIQDALDDASATISVDQVVLRAQAMSCAGCHQLSNGDDLGNGLFWPNSATFTHVDERNTEIVDGVERFILSPALVDAFLPARKVIIDDFLNNKPFHSNHGQHH